MHEPRQIDPESEVIQRFVYRCGRVVRYRVQLSRIEATRKYCGERLCEECQQAGTRLRHAPDVQLPPPTVLPAREKRVAVDEPAWKYDPAP